MGSTEFKLAEQDEVRRLVGIAAESGTRDSYTGKRQWPRFKAAIQLDLKLDPAAEPADESILTYDISEGGVSFWSRDRFTLGQILYLRDRSGGPIHPWLKVCVAHCTRGPQAYLIGCEFAPAA